MNGLPDSAFLYIERGGTKDESGKTVPRSLRHFPVRDANGEPDLQHLRNAISRIPQARIPGVSRDELANVQNSARHMLEEAQRQPSTKSDFLFAKTTQLIKGIDPSDERYVLGIVLEPETVDAQGDIYSAQEIQQAAHRFMEEFGGLGLMHRMRVNNQVKILESYLAPTDLTVGNVNVRRGTWLMAVHVLSDPLWERVKDGDLSGFSIGGSARRVPEIVPPEPDPGASTPRANSASATPPQTNNTTAASPANTTAASPANATQPEVA